MNDEIKKILHDLCTPLAVIKTFLSVIEKVDMPEDIHGLHGAAARSLKKMEAIIENSMSTPTKKPEISIS